MAERFFEPVCLFLLPFPILFGLHHEQEVFFLRLALLQAHRTIRRCLGAQGTTICHLTASHSQS